MVWQKVRRITNEILRVEGLMEEWLNHAPQNILKIGGHNIKFVEIERFSIEFHKTKTKIITTKNQKENTSKSQWEHKEPNRPKRGKTRATKSWWRLTGR